MYLEQALVISNDIGTQHLSINTVDCFAALNCVTEEHSRAAMLFGASDGARLLLGMPLSPSGVEQQRKWRDACEAGLGAEGYAACLAAGSELTLDEACTLALAHE